jgi:hypothetical protein
LLVPKTRTAYPGVDIDIWPFYEGAFASAKGTHLLRASQRAQWLFFPAHQSSAPAIKLLPQQAVQHLPNASSFPKIHFNIQQKSVRWSSTSS